MLLTCIMLNEEEVLAFLISRVNFIHTISQKKESSESHIQYQDRNALMGTLSLVPSSSHADLTQQFFL